MVNHNFNKHEFKEQSSFSWLIPKLMKKLGEDCCEGYSDVNVSIFDPTAKGNDSMKVISSSDIMNVKKPEPVVQPEITENTPEQDVIEKGILSDLENATKTITVTVDEGTVNNLTIPETVSVSSTVRGEFQNGATITTNSSKSLTIDNTSEEPIDI